MDNLKKYLRELISQTLEEMSVSGDAGAYSTPFAFGGRNNRMIKRMKEMGYKEVKPHRIDEISYRGFKNDVSYTTNERKLKRAIHEINKRISEIDKVVDFSLKLKTESQSYKNGFWDKADQSVKQLSEKLQLLDTKIKQLGQEQEDAELE